MPEVRMARTTYSTEHGGRLEVNDVVDVQNSEHETGAETVKRWKRIGLAVDADHAPFDVTPSRGEEADVLRAQIARLEAQLADAQAPLGSAPVAPPLDTQPQSPFETTTAEVAAADDTASTSVRRAGRR